MIPLVFIPFIVPALLLGINFILAKKDSPEREKPSPFECGFDPICSARLPFSLHFFLITVIFLIFDVEITLILPISQALSSLNLVPITAILILFMAILLAGLYAEWRQGALDWYF
uniref:NADH-ubiquinone oxidoreductase chain 3 n=1 Tax=Tullbergia mixta TaxID=1499077 RepID=A0A7T6Y6Z3_9HEXA|nr:NADH dehydrogenase subunit 3 [Tullbergia mixta]QQK54724.1 NADH dehydrogenase subunit 3 [Tullbergia mixta]